MAYSKDILIARTDYDKLEDEDFSLLFELGMPVEAKRFKAIYPGSVYGPTFKDFTVECFGIIDNSAQVPSKEFVNTVEFFRKSGAREARQVWRRRVSLKYTNAVIEAIWNPENGTQIAIVNIESTPLEKRVAEIKKLAEGLQLTLMHVPQGRHKLKSAEQVYKEAVEFCTRFLIENGNLPTANQTARAVGRSKSRFYEDLADCGKSFNIVRAEASKRSLSQVEDQEAT
jgi:hypothetical protein